MKKYSLIFSLLATITAALFPMTASAQQPGSEYAIFNWQNNGDFNAFLNCDVDSITYSRVGLDGKTYSNVVVQEVWTPDSVYRIPIATIDSVAFRAPEPVMKDGIFHITEWHYPYVTDVNDSTALTVTFDASIPSDSLPGEGQVVISDVYDGLLENGFAGRVISVVRTGSTVLVECEEVTLDDVYELLVCVGKSESFIDEDSPAGAPKRIRYEKEGVLTYEIAKWNTKIIDFEGEDGSGNMEITVIPAINLDYAICYNVKDKENHFKCVVSPTLDCVFDSNWKLSKSASLPKEPKDFVFVKIPTKVPGLIAKIGVSYFMDFAGSAELNVKVPLRIQANAGYDSWREDPFFVNFDDGTGIRSINGVSDGNFQIKLDGSVYTGLSLNFTVFFLHEDIANAKIGLKAGPKFGATIDYSNDLTHVPTWYDFKDTELYVEPLVAQLTASVETLFTDKLPWSSGQWSVFGSKDYYLFPTFKAPHFNTISSGLSSTALTTEISNNLIFSVTPGIGLYQNDQLKCSYFSDSTYKRQDKWDISHLQMELWKDHLYPAGTYTAVPIFKFFNDTVKTSLSSTVTIPDPLDIQDTVIIKTGVTRIIPFTGGWGDYSLTNNYSNICTTELLPSSIKITGDNPGRATLYLKDNRSQETKTINVAVTTTGGTPSLSTNVVILRFGNVAVNSTSNQYFNVNGSNLNGVITLESSNEAILQVSPKHISPTYGIIDTTVTVTYHPMATGTLDETITISSPDITSDFKILVKGKCVEPSITVNPTSIKFGNVIVDSTKTETVTIKGTNLTSDLTLTVTNNTRYKVNNATQITLTPTSSGAIDQEVEVSYKPTGTGKNGGYVIITGAGVRDTVYLSGTGVIPTITISPESYEFPTVGVGQKKSKTFTVTATNTTGELALTSGESVGGQFTITPVSWTDNGGKIRVDFQPTEAGNHSGWFSVASTNPAVNAKANYSGKCSSITTSSGSVDCGTVNLNSSTTSTATFTVTGTNLSDNLTLSCDNSAFTLDKASITKNSSNGASGTVKVTYTPSGRGSHSGTITITDGTVSKTVSVSGNCIKPTITISPTSGDFGTVYVGVNQTKTFTVSGTDLTGTVKLTLGSTDAHATFSLNKSEVAAGGTFTVTCVPTQAGTFSGPVTLSCNGAPSKTITLTGTVKSVITTSSSALSFTAAGETASQTVQCKGASSGLTLTQSGDYSYFGGIPSSITQSQAISGYTFIVIARPALAKVDSANATVTISGGGADNKTFNISYKKGGSVTITSTKPEDETGEDTGDD